MHRDYSIDILTRAWKLGSPEGCILYYAVDGGCALELSGQTISLKKAGVDILNLREAARLDVPKGCLGVLLSMDYFALCEMYSRPQIAFTMSCSNKRYDELCSRMQLLPLAYAGADPTVRQKYTEKTILNFISSDMPPDIFTSLNYPY